MSVRSLFDDLLGEIWFARFVQLSAFLLEEDALAPWLARAYYCTLLAGALAPSELSDDDAARPYQDAIRDFLAKTGLPSKPAPSPAGTRDTLDIAARHLAPVANVSPFGHNAPFPYTPPYALDDVHAVLARVPDIAQLRGEARGEALRVLLVGQSTAEGTSSAAGNAAAAVTRGVMALWYASALLGGGMGYFIKTAPIETYASARVWRVIGGNPMGVPGSYYGSWAYPPLEPVVDPSLAASQPARPGVAGGAP